MCCRENGARTALCPGCDGPFFAYPSGSTPSCTPEKHTGKPKGWGKEDCRAQEYIYSTHCQNSTAWNLCPTPRTKAGLWYAPNMSH